MHYSRIETKGFTGRDKKLQSIIRYNMFSPMYYRTDLLLHSKRIVWLLEELIPYAKKVFPGFNTDLARTMATVHDDLEIALGDIMLGEKLTYTKKQHEELYKKEQLAIEEVAHGFPDTINGFRYKQLMQRYQMFEEYLHPDLGIMMDDPEAMLVKYCDKMEGYCEALHELYAGNIRFADGHLPGERTPFEVYTKVFKEFTKKFPLFNRMKIFNHPLLQNPLDISAEAILKKAKPHTVSSILKPIGNPHYDAWKQISIEKGGIELIDRLTKKVE